MEFKGYLVIASIIFCIFGFIIFNFQGVFSDDIIQGGGAPIITPISPIGIFNGTNAEINNLYLNKLYFDIINKDVYLYRSGANQLRLGSGDSFGTTYFSGNININSINPLLIFMHPTNGRISTLNLAAGAFYYNSSVNGKDSFVIKNTGFKIMNGYSIMGYTGLFTGETYKINATTGDASFSGTMKIYNASPHSYIINTVSGRTSEFNLVNGAFYYATNIDGSDPFVIKNTDFKIMNGYDIVGYSGLFSGESFRIDASIGSAVFGGDVSIGANKIKTSNLVIKEIDSNTIAIRNLADNTNKDLRMANLLPYGELLFQLDAHGIYAPNGDNKYTNLLARNTGVSPVEVARIQGATDSYFSMGGSQQFRFTNSGIATLSGTVNMPYYSGDYGLTWSTGLPNPAGTVNGGEMVVYNNNAGVLSSRLYIYTDGAWHYITII